MTSAQNNKLKVWSYRDGDSEVGPYDETEISDLIHLGMIKENTQIRNVQQSDWVAAATSYFQSCFASGVLKSSVVTGDERPILKNTFAWLLACAPFLSIIGYKMFSFLFLSIGLLMTLIFWVMDAEAVTKISERHKRWTWVGLIFVPLYLFLRALLTDRKFEYVVLGLCMYAFSWLCATLIYRIFG